jgi:hypothetical protein
MLYPSHTPSSQIYWNCGGGAKRVPLVSSGPLSGTRIVLDAMQYDRKRKGTHRDMIYAPNTPV